MKTLDDPKEKTKSSSTSPFKLDYPNAPFGGPIPKDTPIVGTSKETVDEPSSPSSDDENLKVKSLKVTDLASLVGDIVNKTIDKRLASFKQIDPSERFYDPVKPSTVENLEPSPDKKVLFKLKKPAPPSRVDRMNESLKDGKEFSNHLGVSKEAMTRPRSVDQIQFLDDESPEKGNQPPAGQKESQFEFIKRMLDDPKILQQILQLNEQNKGKFTQHMGFNNEDVYRTDEGFNFRYLNPWEKPGLNIINDSTLAKLV